MAYTKKVWKDAPDTSTPINAANLNHMEDGIAEADINATAALDGLDDKQDTTDNTLTTTAKTVVGAINEINSDLTDNTSRLNTLINTNHLDGLRCGVTEAHFQFNPALQVLEFFVNLEPNVWLLIQFRATTISYLASTDNMQTWTKYWEK